MNLLIYLFSFQKTRIANLLGVAGTDLPIAEIKRLMMPFLVSKRYRDNIYGLIVFGMILHLAWSKRLCFHCDQ